MTTIVAVKTSTDIYIGADSKVVSENGASLACKIFHCNDVFCAITGLAWYKPTDYTFEESMNYSLQQAGTIEQRIDSFAAYFIPDLQMALVHMKNYNPDRYCEQTKAKPFLGGVVFALFENSSPRVFKVDFKRDGDSLALAPIVTEAIIPEGKTGAVVLNGHTEHISLFLDANPSCLKEKTPTDIIDTLIGIEIEKTPESVGPPIDILHITQDSPSWFRRKDGCFNI